VTAGQVRDSAAYGEPVPQALQPHIHRSAAHPAEECLLEVNRADIGRREAYPFQQQVFLSGL
jgi:hypothetical protein